MFSGRLRRSVVQNSRNVAPLQAWVGHLQGKGAVLCRLDLASLQSVRGFAEKQAQELQQRKQSLSVLVNNAGGCYKGSSC